MTEQERLWDHTGAEVTHEDDGRDGGVVEKREGDGWARPVISLCFRRAHSEHSLCISA